MSNKPVGDVRPSQIITTFGPGAIVDLQTLSVVVAGVDEWRKSDEQRIQEPRLERNLRVKCFYSAPPAEGDFHNRTGTIPSYLFPRYQVCSNAQCGTLSEPSEQNFKRHEKRPVFLCQLCGGKTPVNPAPFIVACPSGHMDDFPWRTFAHRGPTACKQPMQLMSLGKTGTVRDLEVKCKCGDKRSVGDAFGEKKHKVVGVCSRKRPWLGPTNLDSQCSHADQCETLQRGATNSWFPVVKSALSIKDAATPVGKIMTKADPDIISEIYNADNLNTYWKLLVKKLPELESYANERPAILEYILKSRGEIKTDDTDLLLPEWEALRDPDGYSQGERSDFFSQKAEVPEKLRDVIKSVIQVRKLLEVRALTGFTRIESKGGPFAGAGEDVDIAPISRDQNLEWLPAVEVRGEGLFFEFNGEAINDWSKDTEVKNRVKKMIAAQQKNAGDESGPATEQEIREKSRFIVLHSFAHTVMRALALDCGYSGASIRERIYSSVEAGREMSGVLLYTASPDSEGSLGGLIDLGTKERLGSLLQDALRDVTRCSSDPLCASHEPNKHRSTNGAACHACVLVPETSCEAYNSWLDRSLLVPTVANQDVSFFTPKHLGWI
ncbi:DrmB family protein [Pseudomonas pergaminensis]|uniref:DrmB family protein n=1 Tax=Pseudomonas pergaminensis TaxID=2853159 RepID=A0ABW8R1U0_9PSED